MLTAVSTEQDSGIVDLPARWVGQEEGVGQGCVCSLCIMNPFLHIRTLCSYATYVVTYMHNRGGTNIQIFGIFEC